LTGQSERRDMLLNQLSKRTRNERHDHSSPPFLNLAWRKYCCDGARAFGLGWSL